MKHVILDKDHVLNVCKPWNNLDTCRYLGRISDGWCCVKLTDLKEILDIRVAEGTMAAQGDNCEGR
jgi:hypothetical protein